MFSNITFVSSIIIKDLDINLVKIQLDYLVSCNIHLKIYILKEYEDTVLYHKNNYKIKYTIVDDVFNSWIYTTIEGEVESQRRETLESKTQEFEGEVELPYLKLPNNRNEEKDTYIYILNSHRKHEFLDDAVKNNYFNSTHFAWIDSNILSIFKNMDESRNFIKWINNSKLSDSIITFPGCWSKLEKEKIDDVLNNVHWRFCGGFFIGDIESIKHFINIYKEVFPQFLREHNKLVWDFNFWAWLECFHGDRWKPIWYKADHNDSIILCSADLYSKKLENIHKKTEYPYPTIDKYYPTSASYLFHNGQHLLNTRYVNYWIYPNGCYLFNSGIRLIENKNIFSKLEDENLMPIFYEEIEETIPLSITKDTVSIGLEDIRLYELNGIVKYIATTAGYSPSGKSRMIVGTYDIVNKVINNGTIIESPNPDSWCEKNWIPLVVNNSEFVGEVESQTELRRETLESLMKEFEGEEEELFIYKWFPLQIGKINYDTGELNIIYVHPNKLPIFNKIKGSTIFHKTPEGLLGVVHFCEDHDIRHYFHMLVLLDMETYSIKKYSETFYFEKLGVEYCIGFTIRKKPLRTSDVDKGDERVSSISSVCDSTSPTNSSSSTEFHVSDSSSNEDEEYVFWISRHDRDPLMIQINTQEIKWIQ